jgi:hypothetical protein
VDAHRATSDALKRALKTILNCFAMNLTLPAGERRAVVGDDEFQSSHHTDLVAK